MRLTIGANENCFARSIDLFDNTISHCAREQFLQSLFCGATSTVDILYIVRSVIALCTMTMMMMLTQ